MGWSTDALNSGRLPLLHPVSSYHWSTCSSELWFVADPRSYLFITSSWQGVEKHSKAVVCPMKGIRKTVKGSKCDGRQSKSVNWTCTTKFVAFFIRSAWFFPEPPGTQSQHTSSYKAPRLISMSQIKKVSVWSKLLTRANACPSETKIC